MKKITLLLILIPILVITSLNFTNDNYSDKYHNYERNFTCSSCHSEQIGILIGKDEDSLYINIDVVIPNTVVYNFVQLNIKGEAPTTLVGYNPVFENEIETLYNLEIGNSKQNKKEQTIKLKYLKSALTENKEIEIQGVVTNADGTSNGEYSFYKKINLEESKIDEKVKEISIYPTIASSQITITNSEEKTISIINLNGKVVFKNTILNEKEIIDVSNYKNGYYFILIASKGQSKTFKIVVNK